MRGFPSGIDVADRPTREILNLLSQGKLNSVTAVTLTAGSATTALADSRIGPESYLGFMPTTANAAAALAGLYVTGRDKQACVLNHANNAQVDRTFAVLIIG